MPDLKSGLATTGLERSFGCFAALFPVRGLLYDAQNQVTVAATAAAIDDFILPLLKVCGGARVYGSDYPGVQIDEPDVRAFKSVASLTRGVVHLPETSPEVTQQMARFWFGGFSPAPGSFVRRGTPLFVCRSGETLGLQNTLKSFRSFTAVAGLSNLGHPFKVARQAVAANANGYAVLLNGLSSAIFFVGKDLWCSDVLKYVRCKVEPENLA